MSSEQTTMDLIEFLGQQYLCEALTRSEVEVLIAFTDEVAFRKNAIIADIGEVGEALYFVITGEAALELETKNGTVEIAHAVPGELVGEMSFFDREPRSVRLVAKRGDTRLLRLSRPHYQRLRVENPFIAVNLLEQAVVSLDRLFRRVSQDMATYSRYVLAVENFDRSNKRD